MLIADVASSIIADDSEAEQFTRTRLQSGGLLQADMAAFKAANPTCQLADFLRWHSPKDWHPDPVHPQGGSLSDRMAHQVCLQTRCTGCMQVIPHRSAFMPFMHVMPAAALHTASIRQQLSCPALPLHKELMYSVLASCAGVLKQKSHTLSLVGPLSHQKLVLQLQTPKAARDVSAYIMKWTMLQNNYAAAGALGCASKCECPR